MPTLEFVSKTTGHKVRIVREDEVQYRIFVDDQDWGTFWVTQLYDLIHLGEQAK